VILRGNGEKNSSKLSLTHSLFSRKVKHNLFILKVLFFLASLEESAKNLEQEISI
jgi:hypothetical protein